MDNISFNPMQSVNFAKAKKVAKTENTNLLKTDAPTDSVEISKQNKKELTLEDKQVILQKARQTAAGWSVFGEAISTLYFGLRSNKAVAKKYDLDVERDKKLIKQIKKEQTIATLPGAVVPGIGGIVAYIYCRNTDSSEIDVK
ncbi:hypothetical protein IKJ53_02770 [bacterium]|nr:hypothetical protein [bacterium]